MSTATQAGFHDLASMIAFMENNCAKINTLVKEIEEIQHEFESCFMKSRQRYDNACGAAAAWAEAHRWQQPAWLAEIIAKDLSPMVDRKRARVTDLRQELADLEAQRTQIEQQNDKTMELLKKRNPQLDKREEKLKQEEAQARDHFYRLSSAWKKTGAGLGWILQPGVVRKAREAMEQASAEWVKVNERLSEVRTTWVNLKEKTDEDETTLQQAWRLRTAEIARLTQELSTLERDLDAAARAAIVDEVLTAATEAKPSEQAEFDPLFAEVVAAHEQNKSYEAGIGQVAELMGLMKGVCEGLTRMSESVRSVKREQDEHSELAHLRLECADEVTAFHAVWDLLYPIVLDEKKAAEHPVPFADALKQAIGRRLSDQSIEAMFNAMGNELNRATKEQW